MSDIPEKYILEPLPRDYALLSHFENLDNAIKYAANHQFLRKDRKVFIKPFGGSYSVCTTEEKPVVKPLDDGHYVFKAKELEFLQGLIESYTQALRGSPEAYKYAAQIAAFKELMFVENEP